MVQFGTGYQMPMDRDYGSSKPSDNSTNDVGVSIGDLGTSVSLGPVPNVTALGAKMRAGSKTMELNFSGAGKGSAQGQTPGMYGKVQRQALREMQKANEYDFTTHATYGIQGLAGMDQQGNFSRQSKEFGVSEIKRAIEFAADVAEGGTVVVHTGEFQRPLIEVGDKKNFQAYAGEEERATYRIVDNRTGAIIEEAKKSKKIARPVWLKADEDNSVEGIKKGDYIDYFGNKLSRAERVPVYNEEKQHFEVKQMGWEDLVEESKEMTLEAKKDWELWNKKGRPTSEQIAQDDDLKKSIWTRFMKEGVDSVYEVQVRPEEAYIIATLETNAANSRGWAMNYGGNFDIHVDRMKKLKEAEAFYKKLQDETDPKERWKLEKQADQFSEFVPPESKMPTEIIKKQMRNIEQSMAQAREGAASQWAQAENAMEQIKHVESAETYALKESYDAYAQAGITAMMNSNRLEKEGRLKNPLSVAMENLFPESYGAHPDELIGLVKGSRERMKQVLMQTKGMSEQAAVTEAKEHITATFDTGHFNMWRKYWKGDPNKTLAQNDADFDKWSLQQVEKLAKSGVVGHLHLVDNYGYQDDHLAPGEGNTKIKEMVSIFKKHGYKGELIVEPGADFTTDTSGFETMKKAWKMFGSPVYGAAGTSVAPGSRQWGDVQYGWMGQNKPAYFTFGGYSPSEEWTLWSGVPLE